MCGGRALVASTQSPFLEDPLAGGGADARQRSRLSTLATLRRSTAQLAANRGQADFAHFDPQVEYHPARPRGRARRRRGREPGCSAEGRRSMPTPMTSPSPISAGTLPVTGDSLGRPTVPSPPRVDGRLHHRRRRPPRCCTATRPTIPATRATPVPTRILPTSRTSFCCCRAATPFTQFLEAVTDAYWQYDHDKGDDAWPGTSIEDAKYGTRADGHYLTTASSPSPPRSPRTRKPALGHSRLSAGHREIRRLGLRHRQVHPLPAFRASFPRVVRRREPGHDGNAALHCLPAIDATVGSRTLRPRPLRPPRMKSSHARLCRPPGPG